MPNIRVIQSPYIGPFANVEAVNESPSQGNPFGISGVGTHVGELGARVELTQTGSGTKEYQKVQLDSGTAGGAYSAWQLLYWKNKASYIVTNDAAQAIGAQSAASTNNGFRNEVAGVIQVVGTAGNYVWVQQKGNNSSVQINSGSPNPGDSLVGATTASKGTIVAAGTAPTVRTYGVFTTSATSVTTAPVDLDVPGIP